MRMLEYDKTKYKIWNWKHPMVLTWMIMPVFAVNELVFGQKVAKVALVERDSSKSLSERTFIPCPHCETLHSARKWSRRNDTAYRNWFGLYCDNCGNIIPCLINLTSYILLGLTLPIWYLFKDQWKTKWLNEQKLKFSRPLNLTPPKVNYMSIGLRWGLIMFAFMTIIFPWLDWEELTLLRLLLGIPFWMSYGLMFGFLTKAVCGGKE